MTNQELFARLQAGDESVRNDIITNNIGLVHTVANKYGKFKNSVLNRDDMISTGYIGLIRAVDTYDPKKGVAFTTYAVTCINNGILMEFRKIRRTPPSYSIDFEMDVAVKKTGGRMRVTIMDSLEDESLRFEKDVENRVMAKRVLNYIPMLSEPDRMAMCIYLKYHETMNQKDMGRIIGISQPVMSRRLSHAKKQIIEMMTQHGEL